MGPASLMLCSRSSTKWERTNVVTVLPKKRVEEEMKVENRSRRKNKEEKVLSEEIIAEI